MVVNPALGDEVRILILGAAGMLGHALHRVLAARGFAVTGTVRTPLPPSSKTCRPLEFLTGVDALSLPTVEQAIASFAPTAIVNAIGLKDATAAESERLLAVNALFPRRLAALARSRGIYLVHFSTDGVFDGAAGGYDERSLPSPNNLYSTSKYLGEVEGEGALTIRTSIIGRAIEGGSNLVDWALAQRGKTISGYSGVRFTGLPVGEIARFLHDRIFAAGNFRHGLFHLAAAPIDKLSLLRLILDRWGADDVTLVEDGSVQLDRTLTSLRSGDFGGYRAPPWPEMIDDMYRFYCPSAASVPGETASA